MEFLICAAIGIVALWVLFKRSSNKATKDTRAYSPEKKFKSLEEQIGSDHCSGLTCNPNDKCQDQEILFCHTILKRAGIPPEHIIGQFPALVSSNASGIGKIDFAVKTPDERALAIELDGHKYHAKLEREEFNKQQKRQNELVSAGWIIIRFTADDMNKTPDYCIELIKKIYSTSKGTASPMDGLVIFADYNTTKSREEAPKQPLFSKIRGKYYTICNSAKDFSDDKIAQMTFWIKCFKHECGGETTRLKQKNHDIFYWRCNKCQITYNDDNGIPVDKFKKG